MKISVIIPVYNEEDNIAPLAEELDGALSCYTEAEALFVDDGSTDGTWARIAACSQRYDRIKGLESAAHRGQTAAMLDGLNQAAGEILVTMDGDLQNDPTDIPRLVKALGDADCVCGFRAQRKDSWSKRAASRLANRIRNMVTHDGIRDTGCTLKAFRRKCLDDLPQLNGAHRFMPAYFTLHERRLKQISVNHRRRKHGKSKYTNLRRLPTTLLDLFGFWWYRKRYLE